MNKYGYIRLARIGISLLTCILCGVGAYTGIVTVVSRMQLIPAIFAASVLWISVIPAVTLVFGRVYCSIICPSGCVQDITARLTAFISRKKKVYRFAQPSTQIRIFTFTAIALCALCGIMSVIALTDPFSLFARPFSFISTPSAITISTLVPTLCVWIVILVMAARKGRQWCTTVCPIGSLLGWISKYSLYHPDINPDLCINCGRCEMACKSRCVDSRMHTIDLSRCVTCFDCLAVCPSGALTYRRGRHRLTMPLLQPAASPRVADPARRRFLKRTGIMTGAIFTPILGLGEESRKSIDMLSATATIAPPGFGSKERFLARCIGCGQCVSACPSDTIRLAPQQHSLRHAICATVVYDGTFCLYDCVKCSAACPSGALTPLSPKQKHNAIIGKAIIDIGRCLMYTQGINCRRCAIRCPKHAIHIERDENGKRFPVLDFESCIGCGQCRYVCPATEKAIAVSGSDSQFQSTNNQS